MRTNRKSSDLLSKTTFTTTWYLIQNNNEPVPELNIQEQYIKRRKGGITLILNTSCKEVGIWNKRVRVEGGKSCLSVQELENGNKQMGVRVGGMFMYGSLELDGLNEYKK